MSCTAAQDRLDDVGFLGSHCRLGEPLDRGTPYAQVLLLAGATILVAAAGAAARPAVRKLKAVHRMHDLHNGSVGDYVTWLASATAAITAILVLLH